jgi:hypothetical protein
LIQQDFTTISVRTALAELISSAIVYLISYALVELMNIY